MSNFIEARVKSTDLYLDERGQRLSINELRHHTKDTYLAARFILQKEIDPEVALPVHGVSLQQIIKFLSISNARDGLSVIRYSLLYASGAPDLVKHAVIDTAGFLPADSVRCRTTESGIEIPIAEGYLCELQAQPNYTQTAPIPSDVVTSPQV